MIDDFKKVPERQPVRMDTERSYQPRVEQTDAVANKDIPIAKDKPVVRPAPTFRTPEQVAEGDAPQISEPVGRDEAFPEIPTNNIPPEKPATSTKIAGTAATITLFKRWTIPKKRFIIICAVAAVLLLAGGSAFALTRHKSAAAKPVAAARTKVIAKSVVTPIVSPLTGMAVTAAQHNLPVIGVMIENSSDARPQSGLKDAGVVFEAIAEAGITRFLALYQESHPGNVGPIRSSRPYYLDWAEAFDAAYAHVGGSPDALQRIKDIKVKDMDQFYNPDAYHRITTRYAPHNVYSSIDQLSSLAVSKGYDTSSFTSLPRKAESPYKAPAAATTKTTGTTKTTTTTKPATDSRTPANTIDIAISSSYYYVHYDYDTTANNYKRSEGGAPHMDFDSNTQLAPKVVVTLTMPYSLMADGYHSVYNTQGSGKMLVFQDGTVVGGTWSKGDPRSQFVFKDSTGKTLALDAGQTWITVVGDSGDVTFK